MPDDARVPACMESAFRHIARGILAGVAGDSGKEGAAAVGGVVVVLRLPDADRAAAHRRKSARCARTPERGYVEGEGGLRGDDLGGHQTALATTSSQFRCTESTLRLSMDSYR